MRFPTSWAALFLVAGSVRVAADPWSRPIDKAVAKQSYADYKSGYRLSYKTKERVTNMWHRIEKLRPVQVAARNEVIRAPENVDPGPDIKDRLWRSDVIATPTITYLKFPVGFVYGTASAAAQVEGAVKADNRGPSVWDSFAHLVPGGMRNNDTFDVATNFRYLYPLDLARVRAMGVKAYSFSVSWSRVMPLGARTDPMVRSMTLARSS